MNPEETSSRQARYFAFLYCIGAGFILLVCFLYWFVVYAGKAYTDDAYVTGNQVYITPLHDGFIEAILTDDTYLVKESDSLVQLDTTDGIIALQRAEQRIREEVRRVCELFHQLFVYKAELQAAQAEWIRAIEDFEHRYEALPSGAISLEDYQHAVAELRSRYFDVRAKEGLYRKTQSLVQGTSIRRHPFVLAAIDTWRDASLFLERCNLKAPVEGIVAQRSAQVGMFAHAGDKLMSVVPLDQMWINANFKETKLKQMRIGQRVELHVDLYGRGLVYHGRVAGLPAVAGNAVSLLPPQNLSGNWIKIVQRLPVRIELNPEELQRHPLRLGLSTEVFVYLNDSGTLVPTNENGSPHYTTPIFETEERGEEPVIDAVVDENLDPSLAMWRDEILPFQMLEEVTVSETINRILAQDNGT